MAGFFGAFLTALLLVSCRVANGNAMTGRMPRSLRNADESNDRYPNFDEDCWSIGSQLHEFPLDVCAARTSKESIILGIYNTEWLFDGVGDRKVPWDSPTEARQHLDDIAAVIRRNRPDILTLCEVESDQILQDLVDEIGDPDYTPYFVKGVDTGTGQDVALITQGDLVWNVTRTACKTDQVPGSTCPVAIDKEKGVSKNKIALFDSCLFGVKFALISVHFYAFPNDKRRCIWREAQAMVVRDATAKLIAAGFEVIIAGDLNDYSDKYEDVDPQRGPITRVLSLLRHPDDNNDVELENVMQHLPQSERYTAWYDRGGDNDGEYDGPEETSQIDHILMTKGLFNRIRRVWIDHEPNPEVISDHWPLFVELGTNQQRPT